jgi:uncharacterized protein
MRVIFTALLLVVMAFLSPAAAQEKFETEALSIESGSGTLAFTVEMARTKSQHAQGLMYRRSLAADAGMLFVYGKTGRHAMWMKNTFIPLDMVFIDASGSIVTIYERAVPQSTNSIPSRRRVKATLELRGGTVSRLGIKVGDRVRHRIFE